MNNLSLSVFMPVIISFLISVVFCPILIPFLRKLKFGQTEREEGPQSHLKKNGTPTMGGLVILASILLTSLIYIGKFTEILPVLFMTLGFGLIGFLDDYIKVVKKRWVDSFAEDGIAVYCDRCIYLLLLQNCRFGYIH